MIYDFNQEMVINNNQIEKKSEVEIILDNYKLRKNINISEDINFSDISFEKYKKNSKNKGYKKLDKKKIKLKEINENKNIFDKEKEFEKEIRYALSRHVIYGRLG